MIKFEEVTWYSKMSAIIFFIGVLPIFTFYIGTQYQLATYSFENIEGPISVKNDIHSSLIKIKTEESNSLWGANLGGDRYNINLEGVYKKDEKVYIKFYPVRVNAYSKEKKGYYYEPLFEEIQTLEIVSDAKIYAQSYSETEYSKSFTTDQFLIDAERNSKYWYNFTYPIATIKNNKVIELVLSYAG